jgi:cell division initiation protein
MPIRPTDVRRKEFRNGFRGYDANQVDDFLDAVADEFERTYTENSRLREEVSSLRERLQQFEELEGSIRAALVHAEQAASDLRRTATWEADDVRKSASREADLTIREAQARAHQMLAESSARVEHIQTSYDALQEAKRSFTNDFRQLLKTYADVMENMEISSAREIEASLRERLDTEAITVAREAAAHEGEYAAPEPEDEPSSTSAAPVAPTETPDPGAPTGAAPTPAEPTPDEPPAVDEPAALDESAPPEEHAPAGEVEREEPTLAEESSSQSFFDREERGETSQEGGGDSRIFRASRFLRRRE